MTLESYWLENCQYYDDFSIVIYRHTAFMRLATEWSEHSVQAGSQSLPDWAAAGPRFQPTAVNNTLERYEKTSHDFGSRGIAFLAGTAGWGHLEGSSVTRLGDLLDFGQLFKLAITFLGNCCKGVKILNFTDKIIFGQLFKAFGNN